MAVSKKKSARKGWGFDTKFIDPSVRPQDDFYRYAAGSWLKTAKIPEHEIWWGSWAIVRERTDKQLKSLLDTIAKKRKVAHGSAEQMIRDLYRAATDMKTRAKVGTKPIESYRAIVRDITNRDELAPAITKLHLDGTGGLWGFEVDQDSKRSDRYILHLYQGGLGLPERDYYLKNGPEQKRVREAYVKHIRRLLAVFSYSPSEAGKASKAIIEFETALARVSMKREDFRTPEKTYHKLSLAELTKLAPNFGWKKYLAAYGVSSREFIVMQPDYFRGLNRLLRSASLENWKYYLDWHVINDAASSLTPELEKANFEFYGKTLFGLKKMKPRWRIALGTVNGCIGEQLGKLYIQEYFSVEAKRKVEAMVDDLTVIYEERLKELDWMTPSTKRQAIKKLHAITRKFGYPSRWKSYRGLVVRPDDHFGNLLRSYHYEVRRNLARLGKPVDREDWFTLPHTVNAFYSPNMNEIVFPAGILQSPFFDPHADDAVNYGSIGMAIGHELTHGFDNSGAKYDAKGNIRNWWARADKERFEQKGKLVERQFNQFVVEGLHVNGKLTLGENIADLGGLVIAFHAYMRHVERTGRAVKDGFTPEQRFFLGYVQGDRAIKRPEFAKLTVLTDEHAPVECRVNGPLSNMTEFYDAWGVKPGDTLYRTEKKRAKIW